MLRLREIDAEPLWTAARRASVRGTETRFAVRHRGATLQANGRASAAAGELGDAAGYTFGFLPGTRARFLHDLLVYTYTYTYTGSELDELTGEQSSALHLADAAWRPAYKRG